MKKIKIVISLLLTLFLIACNEALPVDKADFIGEWKNNNSHVSLSITPEGQVKYSNKLALKNISVSGNIQKFEGYNFSVGFGPMSNQFFVTHPPTQDAQGNWHMTVNGHELSKD